MAANTAKNAERPRIVEAQDSITRPADSTQYAAGDAISDHATTPTVAGMFTFVLGSGVGRSVILQDMELHKSDHDVTTADIHALFFDAMPAVAGWEDNAALAITDAEFKTCKGVVKFTNAAWTNVVTGDIQVGTPDREIGLVPTSAETKFYVILTAQGTYTPASGEVFTGTAKFKVL